MIGKVISVNKKSITFENNYVGYVILTAQPDKFEVGRIVKLFLYKHTTSNIKNHIIEEMYGFQHYETKELFLNLINIQGIGPKTAINICKHDINLLKNLIVTKNIDALSQLTYISSKFARLIIENINDLYEGNNTNNANFDDLIKALKSLGYQNNEINYALSNINPSKADGDLSDLISRAIKIIATGGTDAVA
jgi:Holliday junction DNA helicase RuvA